jgi:ankyrin repeat protein
MSNSAEPRGNTSFDSKKLAKDVQRACQSDQPGAIREWASHWLETLARLQDRKLTPDERLRLDYEAQRMEQRWRKFQETNDRAAKCKLADAQFFIARGHGFASWPKFVQHLEALARASSPVSKFEAAVDAIIAGDKETLKKLLADAPELVRRRSTRDHRSTLLHYVSANGVEDFRQKTPKNIVEITKFLLNAGADVNAESDAYGGRSTTLGLTATSCHPEDAGVQIPLMELLITHGAKIDGPDGGSAVNGCLHNGRGEAAEFFAKRGARLDLEGAAGVGRLDVVRSFFDDNGNLKPTATEQQLKDAFAWACQFGRTAVVDFLLNKGTHTDEKLKHDGQTGLHWAAYGGRADTVKLLLKRGAPVDVKDPSYDGTPLQWALYAWGNSPVLAERGQHHEVVALLARAGAKLEPEWCEDDPERRLAVKKLRADPIMQAALAGKLPRRGAAKKA